MNKETESPALRTARLEIKRMSDEITRLTGLRDELKAAVASGDVPPLDDSKSQVEAQREMLEKAFNPEDPFAFKVDDLVFSATARCKCGRGLAYPKGAINGSWYCSGSLMGRKSKPGEAHEMFPFAFHKIMVEGNGHTTRRSQVIKDQDGKPFKVTERKPALNHCPECGCEAEAQVNKKSVCMEGHVFPITAGVDGERGAEIRGGE